jgi:glycosyltransferase involved in cell wall biosynthesis
MLLSGGEGFPTAIIEYMALGKPLIAKDVMGIRELLTEAKAGFLIPEDNSVGKINLQLDDQVLKNPWAVKAIKPLRKSSVILKKNKAFIQLYNCFF